MFSIFKSNKTVVVVVVNVMKCAISAFICHLCAALMATVKPISSHLEYIEEDFHCDCSFYFIVFACNCYCCFFEFYI